MTRNEQIEYARRAELALNEFFAPFLREVEAEYAEKIISVAASPDPRAPDIIARLANGVSVARQIRAKFDAVVASGELAQLAKKQDERFKDMSASDRRLVSI